jgi:phosphoenolpyruvate carboxykinase (GTP)
MSAPPAHLTDWRGQDWTPGHPTPAASTNGRFTVPIAQCPIVAEEYATARGVPIDAIIFGGRRPTTVPLVAQSRDWSHGVFMGSTCSSQTTAAAAGAVGVLRRDPMAMLPFIGYHVCDYLQHWLDIGQATTAAALPAIFYVNWFRKDTSGRFLWPGFGDNVRVLKWITQRLEGQVGAVDTPIGHLPHPGDLDLSGLGLSEADARALTSFDQAAWAEEIPLLRQWYTDLSQDGKPVPAPLVAHLDALAGACAG